ncbi:hypothetical protein [Hymenobacter cellulosivorans]|uniref:Uncharacterized protein n=1 Tax=Hymenobacter cellulosivorans TaxID=2932249 RepID=A0ABY4F2R5_9BACT|nr:hypothetical protein [Hymenobacter cellulosivorans]UOQ50850.1 hypothetical protein MUN80_13890 [Hymenobacter cellulosivorans]
MSVPYRTLFFLDNATTSIVEIKRLDLPDEADRSEIYAWLFFDKAARTLTKLEFLSMNSLPQAEEREFEQGSLRFDQHTGIYTSATTRATQQLAASRHAELPQSLATAVSSYLQGL